MTAVKPPSKAKQARAYREAGRRYAAGEKYLLPYITDAFDAYLAVCRRNLAQAAWPALGDHLTASAQPFAQPNPDNKFTMASAQELAEILGDAEKEWPSILDSKMMPGYAAYLGQLPAETELRNDPGLANEISAWREEWLNDRRQELVGVPDAVTSQLRTELNDLARQNGTSVADARDAAQRMLNNGYPSWSGRANLIARTEVVSANNQASLASWKALAGASGMQALKSWIGGTRPTHSAVSGETIGINENFQVGDSEMNGPGDSAGGPSEVCNCKCSLSFELTENPEEGTGLTSVGGGDDEEAFGDEGGGEEEGGGGAPSEGEGESEPFDYESASDDELSDLLRQAGEAEDDAEMERILNELSRRDDADAAEKVKANAPAGQLAEDARQEAEYDALLNAGVDPEQAFSDVYGQITDQQRKQQVISELRSQGYSGKGWEHMTQDVFQQEAERMYWQAENETKGYFLNAAGKAAHIDPQSLFTGPEVRARKYASDELRQFWANHGRLTVDDVRASLLGGSMRSSGTAYWA